jgi:hypothetical protein
MKGTVVVALAAAVVALAVSAEGAQPVFGPVEGGAYDELLPILVRGRTFVPSFKTRFEYDDNIFTEEHNPVAMWKFVIEPKFDIHILRELAYYGLSYQYSLQYYEDRHPRTDQSHDVSLTLNRKLSERVEVRVRDLFRKMQEPEVVEATVTEGIEGERVVTRRLRNDRDYNVLSPAVTVTISPRVNATAAYENIWVDYEDRDVSFTGDRVTQNGSLSTNFVFSSKTYITLFYRYQDNNYKYAEVKADSTSNFATLGLTHQFSPTLTGSVQAGGEWRTYADYTRTNANGTEELVTGQTQTAPYINASVRAPLSQTLSTELGYTYRIEETTQSEFLSQELQSVYLGISQSFTDRLSAVFNATFDFGTFSVDEARYPDITTDFQEQTLAFALVLRYKIKANWHAEVGWRFTDTDSDFAGNSYRRNRAFIGISTIF